MWVNQDTYPTPFSNVDSGRRGGEVNQARHNHTPFSNVDSGHKEGEVNQDSELRLIQWNVS